VGPRTSCGAEVPTRGSLKICRGRAGLTYLRLLATLFVASAANTAVAQQSAAPSSPPSHADSGGKPSPGAAEGAGNTAASTRPAENAKSKGDTDKGGSKELPATKAPANTANGKPADKPALKDRGASKGSTVGPGLKGTHERAGTNEKGSGNNAIDTRITVQPRPVLKLPLRPSVATIPPNSRTLFHQSSPREIASPVRNATGILVSTPHAAKTPIVGPSPTAAYGSAIGSAPHAVAIAVPSTARQGAASIVHVSPVSNSSVITGTGATRPGAGAGVIGGPAKNVAGINGTAFRPKRP
jgi:hypothetical protein